MKRKRAEQQGCMPLSKRQAKGAVAFSSCLIRMISQYSILESITSYLFPKDLLALALCSKAAYKAVFPRRESYASLLKKMACNGNGILIRKAHHHKSTYTLETPNTREYAQCGMSGTGRECESKPCHSCGLTTCNECRIHCVYQSIYTPPDEADELPMVGGFVLLHPEEFAIMSPGQSMMDHVGNEIWDIPKRTYHDQGVLDLPLDSTTYACPEAVTDIINCNLGNFLPLKKVENDANLFPFWELTERRKRQFCDGCLDNEREVKPSGTPQWCKCTLRERFLDRWLCLKCFVQEDEATKTCRRGVAVDIDSPICSCGRSWGDRGPNVMCLWCFGEVASSSSTAP